MAVSLYPQQQAVVDKLANGKVIHGGVGSGKSITSLAYYFTKVCDGVIHFNGSVTLPKNPVPLYIITTANKRDKREWVDEYTRFLLTDVVVDSWNNLHKYADVKGAFFIFDEQRLSGYGAWAKNFIKVTRANQWILLTATPGDVWMDYCVLFIANGLYRNKTEFCREHVVYHPYRNYPQIQRYIGVRTLERHKADLLIEMKPNRVIPKRWEDICTTYDRSAMNQVVTGRWDIQKQKPLRDAAAMCRCARRLVNGDKSRLEALDILLDKHPRIIVFYNFDYELAELVHHYELEEVTVAQWNGHQHDPLPEDYHWIYLVQYSAGAEGWECTTADTVVFYSLTYSYKAQTQAAGRVDRTNTPYEQLYYYRFVSDSWIDKLIMQALERKERFNEQEAVNQAAYYERRTG